MIRRVGLAAVVCASVAMGCGGVASGTLQLKMGDKVQIRVSPDGAVVMNKQRVATIDDKGKVIARGKLVAWLHNESIRLPGGAQIPIKTDPDGNLYLPKSAQEQAGINAVRTRVGKGGAVVTKAGGATNFVIDGADDLQTRRVGLLMLVLFANPPVDIDANPAGDIDDAPAGDIDEDPVGDIDEE